MLIKQVHVNFRDKTRLVTALLLEGGRRVLPKGNMESINCERQCQLGLQLHLGVGSGPALIMAIPPVIGRIFLFLHQ